MDKTFGKMSREEKLDLFADYIDGAKIEVRVRGSSVFKPTNTPSFHPEHAYRKALTEPSINWDHVAKEYNYMATDKSGATFLYKLKPHKSSSFFNSESYRPRADIFASFVKGTCDWENSLVKRPEQQQ